MASTINLKSQSNVSKLLKERIHPAINTIVKNFVIEKERITFISNCDVSAVIITGNAVHHGSLL